MKPSLESPTPAPPVALLTMGQVAQRMSVSKRTVLRWIETGLLPATRVGAVIRIKPHDLEQLIAQHQMPVTKAPVSTTAPHPNDRQPSRRHKEKRHFAHGQIKSGLSLTQAGRLFPRNCRPGDRKFKSQRARAPPPSPAAPQNPHARNWGTRRRSLRSASRSNSSRYSGRAAA